MADREIMAGAKMNRRGLLKCMAWTGTGVVWTLTGGVPRTLGLVGGAAAAEASQGALTFVQISDSHIGFHLPPNPDPSATLTEAINKIKAMPTQPAFLVHTGDISHLSKEEQWDEADQIIKSANKQVFFLPGEHDVADADNGKAYLERYGKNTHGKGWYSFDTAGVHFVGLINVFEFQPGFKSAGLAKIGDEQLEWLEKDVKGLSASTPIVLMAHLPLWTIYEQWGWGTADAGRALGYLKRFGSVTVLNGHIHQIIQKVEGNVTFHTAEFDGIPAAGAGDRSRSWADEGRARRGIAQVPRYTDSQLCPRQGRSRADRQHARRLRGRPMSMILGRAPPPRGAVLLGAVALGLLLLAGLTQVLAGETAVKAAASPATVNIDNFAFAPATLTVTAGTTVTWKNEDDSPHRIGDKDGTLKSAALDTDDTFSHTFAAPGEYPYICTIHPYMVGKIIVKPAGKSS